MPFLFAPELIRCYYLLPLKVISMRVLCEPVNNCSPRLIESVYSVKSNTDVIFAMLLAVCLSADSFTMFTYEPRSEKTGLRGFRPGPTQTELHSHRRWLES